MTLHRLRARGEGARRWACSSGDYKTPSAKRGVEPVRCDRPVFCEWKLVGFRPIAQLSAVRLQRLVLLRAERRAANLKFIAMTCDQGVGSVQLAVAPVSLERCQSLAL